MGAATIIALVIGIPLALFPAAYVGYLTFGGIFAAIRERKATGETAEGHAGAK